MLNVDRINHQELKKGSVCYFIDKTKGNWEWYVKFGIVEENYTHSVCVMNLAFKDKRLVNGIPFNEFPFGEKEYKIPKGFNYTENELFTISTSGWTEEERKILDYDIRDKESILKAYKKGLLIPVEKFDYGNVTTSYENGKYKIVKTYPYWEKHIPYSTHQLWEVFENYDDAQEYVDKHYAEIRRVAALSDLEYSIEEIENTLTQYKKLHNISDDSIIDKYRKFIMSFENLEDVETRVSLGEIQWKYTRNKKWKNVVL